MRDHKLNWKRVDSEDLPVEARDDAWRRFSLFHAKPLVDARGQFRFARKGVAVGDTHLTRMYSQGHVGLTQSGPQRTSSDSVFLSCYASGQLDTWHSDGHRAARRGSVMFNSLSTRGVFRAKNLDTLGVTIPYDVIGFEPSRHPAFVHLAPASPIAKLVSAAIATVFEGLESATHSDSQAVLDGLAGLVNAAILKKRPTDEGIVTTRAAFKRAALQYIEENLTDPGLGAETLCNTFGVSRSTVYREFAPENGVARSEYTTLLAAKGEKDSN